MVIAAADGVDPESFVVAEALDEDPDGLVFDSYPLLHG